MRAFPFLAKIAVATVACHLAYWAAVFLIRVVPQLTLAALTDVEILRFYHRGPWPGISTRFPADGSPTLYAAYLAGFLIWAGAAIPVALAGLRKAAGWLRLFLIYSILWVSAWLLFHLTGFVISAQGPLGAALRVLGPGQLTILPVRIFLTLAAVGAIFAAVYAAIGHIFQQEVGEQETGRLRRLLAPAFWLAVPTAIVGFGLAAQTWRGWGSLRFALFLGPLTLALTMGLIRFIRAHPGLGPPRPLRLRPLGAAILLSVWALTWAGLQNWTKLTPSAGKPEFRHFESQHWHLHVAKNSSGKIPIQELAEAADRRVENFSARLGIDLETISSPKLSAYLYTSPESKRLATESGYPFHVTLNVTLNVKREDRLVHHVLEQNSAVADPRGDAVLLMQVAWGPMKAKAAPVARALAGYALGHYHDYELADYAGRITREEKQYSLREIFQLGTPYLSPLVRDALSSAWVDFQVGKRGRGILRTLYQAELDPGKEKAFAQALGVSWEKLESEWAAYLDGVAAKASPAARISAAEPFFHRGICFSHELRRSAGYGSDRAAEELGKIRALGANSIALIPYAFTRAPAETSLRFRTSETDFRVIRALRAARRASLRVALKPQLWARRFTGDIVFDDTKDFLEWFQLYRRWLLHFARLAELHAADLLVIGTELGGVTGPEQENAWRGLIADIRRVYAGPLTYAAHWDTEFEALPFWDALDYLGLNMYFPLAKDGEPPRAESARVAQFVAKVEGLSRKYNKQVLLTEVGFSSTTEAALKPWEENSGSLDPELQRQCYEVIFQAFYRRPWVAGLYWWKWPSHGYGHPYDGSHSPVGKPAAKTLGAWYSGSGKRGKAIGVGRQQKSTPQLP